MKRYLAIIKIAIAVIVVNMLCVLSPLALHAQPDNPICGGSNDPDPLDYCPLDTWVWVLAAVVMLFVVVKMNRKASQESYKAV